jgi:hypothetical protein
MLHLSTRKSCSNNRGQPFRRPTDWTGLCWLLFVGLTAFMMCLPFMHSIFDLGDEGILLHGAELCYEGASFISTSLKFFLPAALSS